MTLRQIKLDPRLHAYRPDLADETLKGRVSAAQFVLPQNAWVSASIAAIYKRGEPNLARETEALYGEQVKIFEHGEKFSWVQLCSDNYVGYIETLVLSFTPRPAPTHYISTTCSHIYSATNLKSPTLKALPFMAQLSVKQEVDGWLELSEGGFVNLCHTRLVPSSYPLGVGSTLNNMKVKMDTPHKGEDEGAITTALSFLNTPYLWGGKSYAGIDCSGLVQMAFAAAGIYLPRDSDMQMRLLSLLPSGEGGIDCKEMTDEGHLRTDSPHPPFGHPLPKGEGIINLNPADLIFWKGHVAIALDSKTIIHANAHHMKVAIEPIDEAIMRISAKGDEVLCVKTVLS